MSLHPIRSTVIERLSVSPVMLLEVGKPIAPLNAMLLPIGLVKHVDVVLQLLVVGLQEALLPRTEEQVRERVIAVVTAVGTDVAHFLDALQGDHAVARAKEPGEGRGGER